MTEKEILDAIKKGGGVVTWWPGGASHNAVIALREANVIVLEDCSSSQETVFEIRLAPSKEMVND